MSFKLIVRFLTGCCSTLTSIAFVAALATAQPTTSKTATTTGSSTKTSELRGEVVFVEGNHLVVKMSDGEIRHIVASDSQRAIIDGKPAAARDLKVGTKLKATITTTTTSVTERTTTVGSGKVWYVAGNNVILTLPNGENRQYKVADDYKFTVEGRPATVFDLRKGMTVSAQKIVEEPKTMVSSNTVVTGEWPKEAPAPKTEVARAAPAPVPPPVAAAPAPRPAAPAPAPEPAPLPAQLPKTASLLPLVGLAGVILTGHR